MSEHEKVNELIKRLNGRPKGVDELEQSIIMLNKTIEMILERLSKLEYKVEKELSLYDEGKSVYEEGL